MPPRRGNVFDRPPPPPRGAPPPLPPGPPPPGPPPPMHTFGAGHHGEPPSFTFQYDHSTSVRFPDERHASTEPRSHGSPPGHDHWRSRLDSMPPPRRDEGRPDGSRGSQSGGRHDRQRDNRQYGRRDERRDGQRDGQHNGRDGGRRDRPRDWDTRRHRPHETWSRPLLTSGRATTPEPFLSMPEDRAVRRFISLDDVSNSDEAEMDVESQSEADLQTTAEEAVADDANEPARKRRAPDDRLLDDDAASVPKWSNPDPYTVLPPSDENQRKKKDVVKLIRKARVTSTPRDGANAPLAESADFISLDFTDDAEEAQHDEQQGRSLDRRGILSAQADSLPARPTLGKPAVAVLPEHPPSLGAGLGSRKRTRNDEIKEMPPLVLASRNPDGEILAEWLPTRKASSTPWADVDHSETEDMMFWLHKEICDFKAYVQPRSFEQAARENLLDRLDRVIRSGFDAYDVRCFGSFAAGTYLPTADMDVVCTTNPRRASHVPPPGFKPHPAYLHRIARHLRSSDVTKKGSVEVITRARVPIIKLVDDLTDLRVDISFESVRGLIAVDTCLAWKAQFPAMPVLVQLIKQFLTMRGLHEVRWGGLGGFSVTCLVTSMLQNMLRLQGSKEPWEYHLGDFLMEFLDLYGNRFDTSVTGIRLAPPGYFDKERQRESNNLPYRSDNAHRLSIEDPNQPENDVSGGTKHIDVILKSFSQAHEALQRRMATLRDTSVSERRGQSILGAILAGNYESFEVQRAHLWRVQEGRSDGAHDAPNVLGPVQWQVSGGAQRGWSPGSSLQRPHLFSPTDAFHGRTQANSRPIPQRKRRTRRTKPDSDVPTSKQDRRHEQMMNEKNNRLRRARNLRKDYPHVPDIPSELSRQDAQRLRQTYSTLTTKPLGQNSQELIDLTVELEELNEISMRTGTGSAEAHDQRATKLSRKRKATSPAEQPAEVVTSSTQKRLRPSSPEEPIAMRLRSHTRKLAQEGARKASTSQRSSAGLARDRARAVGAGLTGGGGREEITHAGERAPSNFFTLVIRSRPTRNSEDH